MKKKLIITFLLGILTLLLFYNLGEYNQPTADLWINRSYKFFYEVKTKNFDQTYIFYHPGVTLMWLVGPVVYYFPKYTNYLYNQTINPFDARVFYEFNKLALIPVVTTIFGVIILNLYLIKKIFSKNIALIFLSLLISEPFLIGNIRSIHVDALQTFFIFTCFISLLYYTKISQYKYIIISGLFLGLALLTKVTSIIFIPFIGLILLASNQTKYTLKKTLLLTTLNFTILIFSTIVMFYIVWPVMWTDPIQTLSNIYQDGIAESGFEHNLGYDYMYFANIPNNSLITKLLHYPIQFIFRTNGFLLILLTISLIYIFKLKKQILQKENLVLILLSLLSIYYIILMSTSGKMIFRYLLIIYPFFHLFLSIGINSLLKTRFKFIIVILLFLAISESLLTSTNSLTYYNSLLNGITGSKNTIYTDQAGAGLYQIVLDLNNISNIENKSVAIYDYNSFSSFYAGDTLKLKNHNYTTNTVNTDFVIIGVQNDTKYFDIDRKDYKLIKEYKYKEQTHWSLYKKLSTI